MFGKGFRRSVPQVRFAAADTRAGWDSHGHAIHSNGESSTALRLAIDGSNVSRFAPPACSLPLPTRARRLAIAGLWVFASIAFLPAPVQAQKATGGIGIYRDNIVWFSWGGPNASIPQPPPTTVTNTVTIAGQFLRTTCTLDTISGNFADPDLMAYRSGQWGGDIFDDMYFIGAAGPTNLLVAGLANRTTGTLNGTGTTGTVATAAGLVTCNATFGPTNSTADPVYQLGGMVIADAEQSGATHREYVYGQGDVGTTWRLLERFSTCGEFGASTTHHPGSSLLIFNGAAGFGCGGTGGQAGPAGMAFLEGGSRVSFGLAGGGRSAIAIGAMIYNADLGDAPATYGQALHLPRLTFINGVPPDNTPPNPVPRPASSGLFSYPTASLFYAPAVRLGTLVDTEVVNQNSPGATLDDGTFHDDEDGIAPPAAIPLAPGSTYTLNNVACAGPATVYGYIDFNRDGDFADANEKSAQSICPTAAPTTISLSWTLPALANLSPGASFMRLRIGQVDAQVSSPTGNAFDGEVEDYPVTLQAVTTVTVTKVSNGGVGTFAFTGTNGFAAQNITTVTAGTGVAGATQTLTTAGTATTITETAPPAGFALQSITCTGLGAGGTATPTINGTSGGSVVLNAAATATGSDIQCTFTNARPQADLSITKTNTPGLNGEVDQANDTVTSGAPTTYELRVTNNGPDSITNSVVRDTPGAGITCPGGNAVTITGNGVPVGTFTIANLTGAGITLGTLTTGQTAVLSFSCNVQ